VVSTGPDQLRRGVGEPAGHPGIWQEAHLREKQFVKDEWSRERILTMLDREWRAQRAIPSGRIGSCSSTR